MAAPNKTKQKLFTYFFTFKETLRYNRYQN